MQIHIGFAGSFSLRPKRFDQFRNGIGQFRLPAPWMLHAPQVYGNMVQSRQIAIRNQIVK